MSKEQWGEGIIYLRGKTLWIQYSINGKRFRESTKTTDERKARRILRNKLVRADVAPAHVTVDRLLDDLLENYEQNRPKSLWWCRIVVNHLKGHFGYHKAASVGSDLIHGYATRRRAGWPKNKAGNSTINRELALLRHAFHLGARHEPPLVARVPRIPEFAEPAPRQGFFEAAAFGRLLAELPAEVGQVATFAYWTGCRKSEILRLRWSQVDLEERLVRLEITKSGEQRDIPLSGELLNVLTRMRAERDAGWPWCKHVFSRQGKPIRDYYASWRSACERANLGDGAKLLHDLRRTGVRNLIRAGVPEKVAMLISGHKTRSVFDRYHIVQTEDVREAMGKLEKYLGAK